MTFPGLMFRVSCCVVGSLTIACPTRAEPPAVAQLELLQNAFNAVADSVGPSVVAITAKRRLSSLGPGVSASTMTDEDLRRSHVDPLTPTAGSGMVLTEDGLILTNQHVIQDSEGVLVMLQGGREFAAKIVGQDPRSDLAVLQIPVRGLKPVKFAPAGSVRRGHWAIAMGNPYGMTGDSLDGQASVTVGVVSALGRRLLQLGADEDRLYGNLIQTSAPIHQGNSGGPLLNIRGEVIGVITAIKSRAGSGEGFGFAIPMNSRTMRIIDQLRAGRTVEYGYLGLHVSTATPEQRKIAGVRGELGVHIDLIEPGGPADQSGVMTGDVVVEFGGDQIISNEQFVELIGASPVDESQSMTVLRRGKALELTVRPKRREPAVRRTTVIDTGLSWLGLRVADLQPKDRQVLGLADGEPGIMVSAVQADSPAERAGLAIGHVITTANGTDLTSAEQFRVIARAATQLRLDVRGRAEVFVVSAE